jgi:signal transduction histidine kinase
MPYRSIEDPAKLRRVLEATLLIEADLELSVLLRHIVEEACSITNARYGALGVLDESRTALSDFITVGLKPEEEEAIGPLPTGKGVLGLLISDPKPRRIAELGSHLESSGFPANHPPMTSFLGVPIKVRDEVYGNLYLTDKVGWTEFTGDDEALIVVLAVAAGVAIENARLHQRVHEVAVYEERDRLARDLHDTVIQHLFAIGLSLQSIAAHPSAGPTKERLSSAIADIDDTIRQVRTSIFELGSTEVSRGVRAAVLSLVEDLAEVTGFDVQTGFEGPVDTAIPATISEHILAVIREAVTNVGRHADATSANVTVSVSAGRCIVEVSDNGKGIARSASSSGLGLGNLGRRAEKLHGRFEIENRASGGTLLTWEVPLDA